GGGRNVLAVRVDNSGKTSRWYSGSGIYRHTWLTVTGSVRVPLWGVYVTTPDIGEHGALAQVEVQVANSGGPVAASVRMTVLDPRGQPVAAATAPAQTLATGATRTYVSQIPVADPALWSPERPDLYRVAAEILVEGRVADTVTTTFGIRSLVFNAAAG